MRSFASLAAFASIAFAAVASALPTIALPGGASAVGNGISLLNRDVVEIEGTVEDVKNNFGALNGATIPVANAHANQARGVPALPLNGGVPGLDVASGALAPVAGVAGGALRRAEVRALGDIIVDLNGKIQPLCHDLSAAVSASVSASAALDVSMPILEEIKVCLVDAKAEIEALVNAHLDGAVALSLQGKALTVRALADIYAQLSVAVVVAIGLVIKACAAVKTDILVQLVVDISLALAACITLGAQVAVDLIVELKPLIQCVVTIIFDLHLQALIQVFGLVQA